jgi:outer membrane protein
MKVKQQNTIDAYSRHIRVTASHRVTGHQCSAPEVASQGTMIVPFPTLCLAMVLVSSAIAQGAPVSWSHPWHSSEERKFVRDATAEHIQELRHNSVETYSLAKLIDVAESNNPETRVAWERGRAQAASLWVARSELYPTLAAAALPQTNRVETLFGSRFDGQTEQNFEVALDLSYTVFDFGARRSRINAAKVQILAANFAFNDIHRNVIYQVEQSYYRLLSSMGQEDAARASLANAQAVQEAAEDRLAHGLATLPHVLEARSATAQACSADVLACTQVLTSFADLAFRTRDSIQSTKRSQP